MFAARIILISVILYYHKSVETCSVNLSARWISDYENQKVVNQALWSVVNVTRADCCKDCYNDDVCVSFHYAATAGVCVGLHYRHDDANVTTINADGYSLFVIDKVGFGTPCVMDDDCATLRNGHCHQGACRCDVGYDVYLTRCRKLTECPVFSNNVTVYDDMLINGNNFHSIDGATFNSCMQECSGSTMLAVCKSADYNAGTNKCYLQEYTWYDVTSADRGYTNGYRYIQRDCQWN